MSVRSFNIEQYISDQIIQFFNPTLIQLENESHMHSGPSTQSHFKLTVVSDAFSGLSKVKRHQKIYGLLDKAFADELHALSIYPYSESEWVSAKEKIRQSPNCMGGSKNGDML